MSQRWADVLDEFERALAAQEAAASAADTRPIRGFDPPGDLGPIPAALAPRAEALLARSRALEGQVGEALGRVQRQRVVTDRFAGDSSRRRPSTFVDRGL